MTQPLVVFDIRSQLTSLNRTSLILISTLYANDPAPICRNPVSRLTQRGSLSN